MILRELVEAVRLMFLGKVQCSHMEMAVAGLMAQMQRESSEFTDECFLSFHSSL